MRNSTVLRKLFVENMKIEQKGTTFNNPRMKTTILFRDVWRVNRNVCFCYTFVEYCGKYKFYFSFLLFVNSIRHFFDFNQ